MTKDSNQITVGMHEAKTRLSELVRLALEENADIIITQRKKPVMRLVPYTTAADNKGHGLLKGKVDKSITDTSVEVNDSPYSGISEPCHRTSKTPMETLRGSVLSYDDPTAPVADEDWEANH
ncbi:type II toxin-antitoxin system Phd/YefM family antitoxin [Endozoicomonas sp. GU-1]|uniref:type II toxin-antitoxin system Phd/YefM family antitoxin n=1 Tax=Endozoicomonas sp. GU-1 TaxID=3009078 RepID=UPI0022B336B6|nr:type II toxin-antitoxin system Phd/YefM family antitoxin [Endozoicomonas sp. GU-1]WBA79631.1 type II toxin-antitoxin system Phd/YefM family antitoxin [Endozoicomonas sp. GU-1]WBA87213.1 type II toxin-antitoxin system Phd/YefM family antitoxin [Endozoicomonas sp. GU-1]